jgi:hypothetical protein
MNVPTNLHHKPIIAVNDYDKIDAIYANNTDAIALSIGQAQYEEKEISVKVWRYNEKEKKIKRQSEELPIHRNLDLSILIVAALLTDVESKYPLTSLREEIVDEDRVVEIKDFFKHNEKMLRPRLEELRKILNTFFDKNN